MNELAVLVLTMNVLLLCLFLFGFNWTGKRVWVIKMVLGLTLIGNLIVVLDKAGYLIKNPKHETNTQETRREGRDSLRLLPKSDV